MKKYTVILLYPDYLAEEYGKETYMAWVTDLLLENGDPSPIGTIIQKAQRQALNAQSQKKGIKLDDFHPLFVFEGHLSSLI